MDMFHDGVEKLAFAEIFMSTIWSSCPLAFLFILSDSAHHLVLF
jgi:hypothetical protein